jgi:uncharacterized protein YjaZ
MGSLDGIGMVADFSKQEATSKAIDGILVHELTHQLHDERSDENKGNVLERIVAEGLASYVNCVSQRSRKKPASCVAYSNKEWRWAMENEDALKRFIKPILMSKQRADIESVANRRAYPIDDGPSAIGYFIGYRIVQSYVDKHGQSTWKDLISMPVSEVLRKSNYSFE